MVHSMSYITTAHITALGQVRALCHIVKASSPVLWYDFED